jgi:hypothetical protein
MPLKPQIPLTVGMTSLDDELTVANKYGLYWADSRVEDKEGRVLADGCYLSLPERYSETFFVIFDKLRQLNDHCFNQLLSSEIRLHSLRDQRASAAARTHSDAAEFDYLDDQIPMWEDNVEVIGRATPVILLCSFIEWGLKLVTKELCGAVPRKRAHSLSDFTFLLQHLERDAGLHLRVDLELVKVVNAFRSIRNAFAHGRWEALNAQLDAVSLRTCFETVAEIFAYIEAAAWSSPWGDAAS